MHYKRFSAHSVDRVTRRAACGRMASKGGVPIRCCDLVGRPWLMGDDNGIGRLVLVLGWWRFDREGPTADGPGAPRSRNIILGSALNNCSLHFVLRSCKMDHLHLFLFM